MTTMEEILDLDLRDNPELLEVLKSSVVSKKVEKGTILQNQGEPTKAFFVKKGLLRSYTIDEKGKEHVFMFAPEGWVISDIESQAKNQPAELFIDCLEDSELDQIDANFVNNSGISISMVKGTERLLRRVGVLQRRVIMLMSATALERYQHFTETYPNIVNRVPQKMIASYLGITPEALSKIKAEQLRKG